MNETFLIFLCWVHNLNLNCQDALAVVLLPIIHCFGMWTLIFSTVNCTFIVAIYSTNWSTELLMSKCMAILMRLCHQSLLSPKVFVENTPLTCFLFLSMEKIRFFSTFFLSSPHFWDAFCSASFLLMMELSKETGIWEFCTSSCLFVPKLFSTLCLLPSALFWDIM